MLGWEAHTTYVPGKFVIGNAAGTNCLFQLQPLTQPYLIGGVNAWVWNAPHTGAVGDFILPYPTPTGTALASASGTSLNFGPTGNAGPIVWNTVNGAGEISAGTTPFPSFTANFQMVVQASLFVPKAGQYSFTITHHDGMLWGIGGGASVVSGTLDDPVTNNSRTQTAVGGYPLMGGTNRGLSGGQTWTGQFVVNFPARGVYPVEIDFDYWFHSGLILHVQCNGQEIAHGSPETGTTQPTWPAFSAANAPQYATVAESAGQFVWANLGPVTDFAWHSSTTVVLPNTTIIDPNSNIEAPFRSGVSGTGAIPTFATILNGTTADNPNLIWINQGAATTPAQGTVSAFAGGYQYGIALVDTLDDTVSNLSPLSPSTGNFVGASGVSFAPGSGLPPAAQIDPQADYVAIFRTTDGNATPFLIPGSGNSLYTLTLADYLANGFTDKTADTGLNNLIEGAMGGQNTPPEAGAKALVYHLNRIFFAVGNTVYWTAGPDTPVGNGVNGVPPLNFAEVPSPVTRIVPTAIGALVFTVSDVFLIPGKGITNDPIQGAQPFLQGVGLQSYNALDINGSIIGLFTTDRQFVILDPSSGVSFAGFPIGDRFRKNDGRAGTSWSSTGAYVTWHVDGEDQAWYVADGQFGWYRLMPTPSPEVGYTWSPFASIVGGCKAVQSVETAPGVHTLLVGPSASGAILNRDLTVFTDNTQPYAAWAVVGSAVLAQPGQIAVVTFITTDSVNTGKPLALGVLMDEALPYYTGPIEMLTHWAEDPPGLPQSKSIFGQRFYMDELEQQAAACRHMQLKVMWDAQDTVQNELLSLTVFGGFMQEK